MTYKDKIDFIDDTLSMFEDYTHGDFGTDIRISRKYITELKELLPSQPIGFGETEFEAIEDLIEKEEA